MANVTAKMRVQFLSELSTHLKDLNTLSTTSRDDLEVIAKKINVSSMYKLTNMFSEVANEVNEIIIKRDNEILELLEVLKQDKYNVGEYTELINSAIDNVTANKPSAVSFSKVDLSADAQEDVSRGNISALDDFLYEYGRKSLASLMDISADAKNLRSDESVNMVANIGKSIEDLTNRMIRLSKNCNLAVAQFAKDYGVTLNKLEELSSGMKNTAADFATDGEIAMNV